MPRKRQRGLTKEEPVMLPGSMSLSSHHGNVQQSWGLNASKVLETRMNIDYIRCQVRAVTVT